MLNKFYIICDLIFVFLSIYLFFIKRDILLGSVALLIAIAFGLAFTFSSSANRMPEGQAPEE